MVGFLLASVAHAEIKRSVWASKIGRRKQVWRRASKRINSMLTESAEPDHVPPLSEQETEVLRLFAEGKNATKIARQLGITLQTLRNHLHRVNQKLGTHNPRRQ